MRRFFLVLIVAIALGVAAPVHAEENGNGQAAARTFDQQKLERTRALMAESTTPGERGPKVMAAWQENKGAQDQSPVLAMFKAMFLCIGVLLVGVYGYRRFGSPLPAGGRGRRIKVIERIALTNRTSLMLVTVNGRELLLSVGSEQVGFQSLGRKANVLELEEVIGSEGFDPQLEQVCSEEIKLTA